MTPMHQFLAPLVKLFVLVAISMFSLSVQAVNPAKISQDNGKDDGSPYTLETCPVSGNSLAEVDKPFTHKYDGQQVQFCCKDCVKAFDKDPDKYMKNVHEKVIAAQKPYYPLDTCVVSGEKLSSDKDKTIDYVYKNRLVRFCCPGCIEDFNNDPEKYLKKLDNAVIDKQEESYPLTTCIVSGEKLGGSMGEPIKMAVGNRLVEFCCNGCIKKFQANPAKYMHKLDAEARKKGMDPAAKDVSMATCPMSTCAKDASKAQNVAMETCPMGTCAKDASNAQNVAMETCPMGTCSKSATN